MTALPKLEGEDKKLHELIMEDCKDMDEYAKPAREVGKEVVQGYMAIAADARQNDGRSRLFPPVLHGIVYSSLAMQAANTHAVTLKHRKASSEPKMKFLNAALKHSEQGDGNLRPPSLHLWHTQSFDKELFGVGARYQSYLLQTRNVKVKDESGKWKEKTMIVHDDIWDENLDFFHFGVSRDMLPGMFQGRACYFDKFYSVAGFKERFDTPFYENVKTAADFFEKDKYIRVRYHFDLFADRMYVTAMKWEQNSDVEYEAANSVRIRKDHILDYGDPDRPQKFLPVSTVHNDITFDMQDPAVPVIMQGGRPFTDVSQASTNKTFWTRGNGAIVKGLVGLKRALWRAKADHVKYSSVHFLLAQSAGVHDQVRTADLYGIVPIKAGDGGFDVKSLTQGSDFLQKAIEEDEGIENMISSILGNDWRRTAGEMTNEKATVAAIRQQVQRLRAAQNAKFNDTGPVVRHYRIRVNLMQQYYTQPTEIHTTDIPDGLEEQEILRNADGHVCGYKKYKEIPIDDDVVEIREQGKYKIVGSDHPKAEGQSAGRTFKGRDDHLKTEEEPDIFIEPGSTFAEMKALERSLLNETMAQIQPFFGLVYPGKDGMPQPVVPKEGVEYILEKVAEANDWDSDKLLNRTKAAEIDQGEDVMPAFGSATPEGQSAMQQMQTMAPQVTPGMPPPGQPQQPQQAGPPQPQNAAGMMGNVMGQAVTL